MPRREGEKEGNDTATFSSLGTATQQKQTEEYRCNNMQTISHASQALQAIRATGTKRTRVPLRDLSLVCRRFCSNAACKLSLTATSLVQPPPPHFRSVHDSEAPQSWPFHTRVQTARRCLRRLVFVPRVTRAGAVLTPLPATKPYSKRMSPPQKIYHFLSAPTRMILFFAATSEKPVCIMYTI